MGNGAYSHLKHGHDVLFAYEEAIGFMCGSTVLDKDGISAAAVMAEFAGWLETQGKTFRQQLEELYVQLVEPGCGVVCVCVCIGCLGVREIRMEVSGCAGNT